MSITVKFLLSITPESYNSIASKLKRLDLEVLSLEEYENRNPDPNSLICMRKYGDGDALKVLETINAINNIEKVNKITPLPNIEREKQPLYKHRLIPMAISTIITILTLAGAVHGLRINLNNYDYFFIVGVPTITTFFSQLLYKYF